MLIGNRHCELVPYLSVPQVNSPCSWGFPLKWGYSPMFPKYWGEFNIQYFSLLFDLVLWGGWTILWLFFYRKLFTKSR